MQNTESLQMIKEQLKIKSVELRKATEEKGKVAKKFNINQNLYNVFL